MVPTISHERRPHLSDRTPTIGFKIIPVSVETDIINPRKTSPAPKDAANTGKRGVLPIWYADRTIKSANEILINSLEKRNINPNKPIVKVK